jgi:hypothetical protein
MLEQTVRCRHCGALYVFYAHYAGDQSACPECVAKARRRTYGPVVANNGPFEKNWRKGKLEFGPDDITAEESKLRQEAEKDPGYQGQLQVCAEKAIRDRMRRVIGPCGKL